MCIPVAHSLSFREYKSKIYYHNIYEYVRLCKFNCYTEKFSMLEYFAGWNKKNYYFSNTAQKSDWAIWNVWRVFHIRPQPRILIKLCAKVRFTLWIIIMIDVWRKGKTVSWIITAKVKTKIYESSTYTNCGKIYTFGWPRNKFVLSISKL